MKRGLKQQVEDLKQQLDEVEEELKRRTSPEAVKAMVRGIIEHDVHLFMDYVRRSQATKNKL